MSEKDNSGPAFPVSEKALMRNLQGMTMRDYFAAKAMPLAFKHWRENRDNENQKFIPDGDFMFTDEDGENGMTMIADTCYEMADAMLQARKA